MRFGRKNRILLLCLLTAALLAGCVQRTDDPAPTEIPAEHTITAPTPAPKPTTTPEPAPRPTPAPTPEPTAPPRGEWMLSFAGDCTIGTLPQWQNTNAPINMLYVMGDDWAYPFSNVADVFRDDDFTMVNLEGTFTDSGIHKAKAYCFKAPPAAAETLVRGGIEAVTLANNHSRDYLEQGLADTRAALEAQGVAWADADAPLVLELPDGGPRLGVIAYNCVEAPAAPGSVDAYMQDCGAMLDECAQAGCDLVFAFVHWGWEYRTAPEKWMEDFAHRLAAAGCDMVIGSHPHVLQCFEVWEGTPICYSLGNFCFGGHSGPEDTDSVIVRQCVRRTQDGFALAETTFLPCSISSAEDRNDFRPRCYANHEAGYARIMEKLGFSQRGAE